jgi:hypothetical protein
MKSVGTSDNVEATGGMLSDTELLALFHSQPQRAWEVFVERYADTIFSYLHHLGFDYDQAMDQFVYVCEKLCEQDFRRLKAVRYAGQRGELTPWLRTVIKNLSVSFIWSVEGRKRLLKPITKLPLYQQRIFELYFWKGLSPVVICEQLQLEHQAISLIEVFDALETIFSHLSQKKLWRLMSKLSRVRGEVSLDEVDEESGVGIQIADRSANPEEALLAREEDERLSQALAVLTPKERLLVQLRYEEGRALKEVAEMLRLNEGEVKAILKGVLKGLRQRLQ